MALPMRSVVVPPDANNKRVGSIGYQWHHARRWHGLSAGIAGEPVPAAPGSEEEFITEHYWGYVRQRDGSAVEYGVEHRPWRVWRATTAALDCEVASIYGSSFCGCLAKAPTSAFVAEGSPVVVRGGQRLC